MPQNWLLFNSVVDHCWANKFYVVYWFAINTQTIDLQRRVCFSWVIDSIAFGPVVDSMMVWWSLSLLLLLLMMVNLNWTCHLYQHAPLQNGSSSLSAMVRLVDHGSPNILQHIAVPVLTHVGHHSFDTSTFVVNLYVKPN